MENVAAKLVEVAGTCSKREHNELVKKLLILCSASAPSKQYATTCVKALSDNHKDICACHKAASLFVANKQRVVNFQAFSNALKKGNMNRTDLLRSVKTKMANELDVLFRHQEMFEIVQNAIDANQDVSLFFKISGHPDNWPNSHFSFLEIQRNLHPDPENCEFFWCLWGRNETPVALTADTRQDFEQDLVQLICSKEFTIVELSAKYDRNIETINFDDVEQYATGPS